MRRILALLFMLFIGSTVAVAAPLSEQQKIDAMLDALGNSDITFVRNGEPHDGAYAKQHLKEKLGETKGVKTAKDFIVKVGSESSHTGQPYLIKTKDGKAMTSAQWLQAKLADIDKGK